MQVPYSMRENNVAFKQAQIEHLPPREAPAGLGAEGQFFTGGRAFMALSTGVMLCDLRGGARPLDFLQR